MPHVLVVGGTGMLAPVALHLASLGNLVSVVARGARGLEALVWGSAETRGRIHPIQVDYADSGELLTGLVQARERFGDFLAAVCWIHGTAPDAPVIVADQLDRGKERGWYFDVLGSAESDPARKGPRRAEMFARFRNLEYRRVALGFVLEDRGARWLTNDEISRGVIRAIEKDGRRTVIGRVRPWSRRPGRTAGEAAA